MQVIRVWAIAKDQGVLLVIILLILV